MSKRTKKTAAGPQIWADAKEVPVADVAPPNTGAKKAKWLRRAVVTSVVLLPMSLFTLLIVAGNARSGSAAETTAAKSSQGRGVATTSLQRWLSGVPAPLPGGLIVSWDGAEANSPPGTTTSGVGSGGSVFSTERDAFTVIDSAGRYYRAEMLVALDPAGGASVLAGPSLTLIPGAREAATGDEYSAWGSLQVSTVPDAVVSAIHGWATAYTSGDPSALRLAVGDKDPNHAYLPMPDATGSTVQVKQGAYVGVAKGATTSSTMIVRVSLALSAVVVSAPAGQDGNKNPPQGATYDLLLEGADTAAPAVVAWGGPGSGPTLTPYANAFPSDVPTTYLTSDPASAPQSTTATATTASETTASSTTSAVATTKPSTPKPTAPQTKKTTPATTVPKTSPPKPTTKPGAPKPTSPQTEKTAPPAKKNG